MLGKGILTKGYLRVIEIYTRIIPGKLTTAINVGGQH